ncbi:hypothetical protein Anas_04199, partial [Armadillidium nasatum]
MRCIGIVLFCSAILSAAIANQEDNNDKENELLATRRQKRSMIFFPAEKNTLKPAVRHKRYPSPNGYRRRFRRNAFDKERGTVKTNTRRNFLDYDGWQPLNRFDPMSEEPTLIYKPPSLERVHFGKDPPKERPLYPVLPVNPPVYVIRAEPAEKEIHAIYGTENINYLHVNPKTQQAKAYSAFGKNRFHERNSFQKNIPPKIEKNNSSSSFSLSDILKSFVHTNVESLNPASNSTSKETEEEIITSIKNDTNFEVTNEAKTIVENAQEKTTTTAATTTTTTETTTSSTTTGTTTTSTTTGTTTGTTTTTTNNNNNKNTHLDIIDLIEPNYTVNIASSSNKTQSPEKTDEENEILNSQFSVKSLAIDDDYYYIYEDEVDENPNYDFQIESNVAKSNYDPFASIIPKVSNVHSYKDKNSKNPEVNEEKEDDGDPYYAEASETVEQRVSTRAPLHQLLRNFDGVQYDQYIFSASENREKEHTDKDSQTTSRSRLTIPFKPQIATGRKISSPTLGVNSRDWYLIDTRSKTKKDIDPRWKSSFDERDYFIDRSTSKYSESQNLYKSFSESKLNALKPHESLTANSLSELLQIFKYVTTPNPIQRFSDFNAYQNRQRTFRYTKPTEPPNQARYFTTFRYTVPVTRLVETTESTPDVDVYGVNDPSKVINDTVAETNSLDGYLFSDSINAPKYSKPEVQPNIVKISEKRATSRKPIKISKKESKMDKDAVQRGDIAPPFVIEIKESDRQPFSESYRIHQGHSRVKVYGLNSDPNAKPEFTTQRSKSTTLDHILMTPLSVSSPITVVTTAPTTTSTTPKVIRKRQVKHAKSLESNEFQERIDVDRHVTVNKVIPRWTRQGPEDRLKGKENTGNIPSTFKIFSDLFTRLLR